MLPVRMALSAHLHFASVASGIVRYLSNLTCLPDLFFNFTDVLFESDEGTELRRQIAERFPDAVVLVSANRGKDIGGHVNVFRTMLERDLRYDCLGLVHSKQGRGCCGRTPGPVWTDELIRSVIGSDSRIHRVASMFDGDRSVGMVALRKYLCNEMSANKAEFDRLAGHFGVDPSWGTRDRLRFVAGTMFWVRGSFLDNFARHPVDADFFPLSNNEVDGQPWNAMERLFGPMVLQQGLRIVGTPTEEARRMAFAV